MKRELGSLLVGASALALAALVIPAAAGSAAAKPATAPVVPASAVPTTQTFTVTKTTTTVQFVGTTQFVGTENATGGIASPLHAQGVPTEPPNLPNTGRGLNIVGRSGPRRPGAHQSVTPASAGTADALTPSTTTVTVAGIDAYDQGLLHPTYTAKQFGPTGLAVEPSDQGLCSNGTFTVELNNVVMQVFTASTLTPESTHGMALERLFTAPEIFGVTSPGTAASVQGDPRCQWDPTSGRWFATQLWATLTGNTSAFGWAGTFVAVSQSATPLGTWNVFFVPDQFNAHTVDGCNNLPAATLPTNKNRTGPANPCFGDEPILGINGNAIFISTNEFPNLTATGPYGVATVYFLDKADLIDYTTSTGTLSPIWWNHLGDSVGRPGAPPAATCSAQHCPWYAIAPAVSDGTYVSANTGTFEAMSNVTFTTTGGTQIALWQFTDTAAVTADATTITGSVTVTTVVPYVEPPLAVQEAGTAPLGALWNHLAYKTQHGRHPALGPIATNTDTVTTAAYDPATGAVWGALNTGVISGGAGVAWFEVTPTGTGSALVATSTSSGYVALSGADAMFPSIAFTNAGTGLMAFSFSGSSDYPSTGYVMVTGSAGTVTGSAHVAYQGTGPQDGFTEYTSYGKFTYRPRWGDYSTALASGTTFSFATEAITQSCSTTEYEATQTCGTTRSTFANWGTSISTLAGS